MTREEAIRILKEHKATFQNDFGWNTSTLEALDMAVKALEQTDCGVCKYLVTDEVFDEETGEEIDASYCDKRCEDTISRKVVLDKIKEVCFSNEQEWIDFRISQGSNGQRDFIIKFIESLPPVTPNQTDALSKIKAEIVDIYCENPLTADEVREMALEIIDKYAAESEDKK